MSRSKHTLGELKGKININDVGTKHPRYTLGMKYKVLFHTTFENSRLNANRMMLCWNSHDALLAACKDALEFIGHSNKTDWDNEITPVLGAAIALTEKGDLE